MFVYKIVKDQVQLVITANVSALPNVADLGLLTLKLEAMSKKKTKLQEPINPPLLIASVSGSATTSSITTDKTTTDTTIWKGGYVTDNFYSYYLDENMVKHCR